MSWSTKYWIIILAALAGVLICLSAYNYGFSHGTAYPQPGTDALNRLRADLRRSETDNREHARRYDELWAELARARGQLQINKAAYTELSRSLDESAVTITELREQLDFYDRILSAVGEAPGLRVHEFVVRRLGATDQYRYELLLINVSSADSPIESEIEIDLEGFQGAQTVLYSLADLGRPLETVKLKYFRALRGDFELPGGFDPVRVRVGVRSSGGDEGTERWFPWAPS